MHAMEHPESDVALTTQALGWADLLAQLRALLREPDAAHIPPRMVLPLAHGGSLFVMPAADARTAMTKLITYTPGNAGTARAAIQGDVLVFDVATGARTAVLHGPTVTARRTAAVSALAAQLLAPEPHGDLLIVGAGVQGRAHLEAFAQCLGTRRVFIQSRRRASAQALADHAAQLGLSATVVDDADAALHQCSLVVTATPASGTVLNGPVNARHFIAAVGAFTPAMHELAPELCRHIAQHGRVVLDAEDARHEAGDLIQAGIALNALPTLGQVLRAHTEHTAPAAGPVLFKSCGWAGWDFAAAQLAARVMASPSQ